LANGNDLDERRLALEQRRFEFEQRKWQTEGRLWVQQGVDRDANQAERYWEFTLKIINVLNGGAALALLTFIGNHPENSRNFLPSLLFFAAGALMSALAALSSYFQLKWGIRPVIQSTAEDLGVAGEALDRIRQPPISFSSNSAAASGAERVSMWFVGLGLVLFACGIGAAAGSLR
jgi:hypothetical protein